MAYKAVIAARKAAEAKQESVIKAVRLGLELKRAAEVKKEAQKIALVRS
nr:hypothetical protein [uncultured Cohaesibacter sp.]